MADKKLLRKIAPIIMSAAVAMTSSQENQALENERCSMTAALQHLEQLDVIGGVLYVDFAELLP